jgi:ligand-binding SRPBCC domain-containing protein
MFKVKGSYAGKDEDMRLMVTERWPNAKYTTRQTEGPFKKWESVQEFEERNGTTRVRHTINYELPRSGKILKMVHHNDADHKLQEGMEGYIRTLKFKMEAHA